MATMLERLEARRTRVLARITEVETQYPKVIRASHYQVGWGSIQVSRQTFESVRKEYRELLDDLDKLDTQIAALNGTDQNAGSYLAEFRETEAAG